MKKVLFGVVMCIISVLWYWIHDDINTCTCTIFTVLDVGQGTGIFIQTKQGSEIVIDTGKTFRTLRELGRVRDPLDRYIDLLMITHADLDHHGITPDIFERYNIGILATSKRGDQDAVSEIMNSWDGSRVHLKAGDRFVIDEIQVHVLWPQESRADNKNDDSLVMMIHIENTRILIPGDITKRVERKLLEHYGSMLNADILVVPHHGSKTSSSLEFIQAVNPFLALISSGADNPYGHPHIEVLERYQSQDIQVLHTVSEGSIVLHIFDKGLIKKK